MDDADLREGFLQRGRDERRGAGEGDLRAELREAEDVGAGDAAEEDVAEDGDFESFDLAEALAEREGIEQGLRRVFVGAVAGVDHRDVEDRAQVAGRAGGGVAHHDGVDAHRTDVLGRVAEGLALHQGGGRRVDRDHFGAELLGRDLEGRAGAGARLEEEVHHRAALHQVEALARGEGGQELVGLAEEQFDLGAGKLFDAGQVFFRPGVLLGHAVRFRWP